jgi:hypothetical protein
VTKGLILYNIANGMTTLKKYVFSYHFYIAKMFEEETNNVLKINLEKQLAKKRPYLIVNVISNFFVTKYPFKKEDGVEAICGRLDLLIVKNHFLVQLVESPRLELCYLPK